MACSRADEVSGGTPEPAGSVATSTPPPEAIPDAPQALIRPRLAYLSRGSTWNLSAEEFFYFLPDTPKAILFRCPARHLSSDASYHYYSDDRFDKEWAFERAPENDFFVKRSVWIRDIGETEWQLATDEATLAEPR